MGSVTKTTIIQGLHDLGLHTGCRVLAHSSLSSFGHVEGGADMVIDALLDVVGHSGTILVPTLTGSEALSASNPPLFDPENTPCWTGRIPETFRQRPDAIRSLHPTHSVAAIGADARRLTSMHQDSITPCDALSPYGLLATMPDSYILLLGVGHNSNTTFHHVEEIVGVDYHMQPGLVRAEIHTGDETLIRHIMLHAYGTPRNFGVMEAVYTERDIQYMTKIGEATVRLVVAQAMVEVTTQCLQADHRILCAQDA
ncbi:MAG: AAC(3) family N-acetyltransferase [Anaerolineae bacterium]|nr:AAC(3) family N-acetyltransferase [Anaerolineae bacterium]